MDPTGRTFQFTLSGIDGTSVENADGTVTVNKDGSVTAENDAEGNIAFETLGITSYLQDLEWNKGGDSHEVPVELTLREVVPDDKGDIAYDGDEHTVKFTVDAKATVVVDSAAGTKAVTVTPGCRGGRDREPQARGASRRHGRDAPQYRSDHQPRQRGQDRRRGELLCA
ncbi:FctA domain-containing protein [Atopobiaceae bacterium 24-176]